MPERVSEIVTEDAPTATDLDPRTVPVDVVPTQSRRIAVVVSDRPT